MYHLGYTKEQLNALTDAEWAEEYSILMNIREQEAKQNKPFG
jgi:hypothetical protein